MKKIISTVLVCVLLLSTMLVLASCAKTLNGTYESEYFGSFVFDGKNVTYETAIGSAVGTYEFAENKDGEEVIVFDFGDNVVAKLISGERSYNEGSDKDGAYIEISGQKYYRK